MSSLATFAAAFSVIFACDHINNENTTCDRSSAQCEPAPPAEAPPVVTVVPSQSAPTTTCTVNSTGMVLCDGQPVFQIPAGPKGDTGNQGGTGATGAAGLSLVFTTADATLVQCPAGGKILIEAQDSNLNGVLDNTDANLSSVVICNGLAGATGAQGDKGDTGDTGAQGVAGQNGQNGQNGATGATGATGAPGAAGLSPITLIRPCGAASSPWKEVLMCLSDGTLLGSFSKDASALNVRLSVISPGTYVNTDDSGCRFTVTSTTTKTTVSWASGHNAYSSWTAGTATCGN